FAARSSAGGSPTWHDSVSTVAMPEWLRLTRSGNTFTGYYSDDGATWIPLGTNTFTMNSTLLVGMAANSRTTSQLTVGTFDNVTTSTWTPPPAAPLNLVAIASNSAVALRWNSSTNATGYNLKRSQVSGGPYATVVSLSATNWADSAVSDGTAYYYIVTATNAAGESAVSAEAGATLLPPVPPAPMGLSAGAGDALVTLNWNDAVGATGYSVKRSLVSGGMYNPIASVGATNFADAGVANGSRYYYVVTATNISGESSSSAEVDARPVSLSLPRVGSSVAANQLQLSWPSDHTGWRLQAQTNSAGTGLGSNWVTIPGSADTNKSLVSIDPANPSVFFRLVYP
ncbi:MAG TPA: hypothetical protein VK327_11910, partial [Candidatus Paceibacterota bacterium]|nr:hypothetical protein [Candidatus Paceibacterota bacterium]